MRKLVASLLLFTAISTPVIAEETKDQSQTLSFYVVTHSEAGNDYWAVTQDGSKSLWFRESDVTGELLKENDTFKGTFDETGKLTSIQKYILQ
ncbi:hypothetical protein [Ammoniphilus sp. 3BR4]|uniref:hypothetical protein n=1 Tax=Ammoniphilus sp. 3BR4 TaxID=3158265 RepID=UPI003465C431